MKNQLFVLFLAFAWSHVKSQCNSPLYTSPDFSLSVQDPACPQVGEIQVYNPSGGVPPYTYTLLPSNISNGTGYFTNLDPGIYTVRMRDACGSIRTRQATVAPYEYSAASSRTHLGCKDYEFTIRPSASSPRTVYGYALNGDSTIIWGDSSVIRLTLSAPVTVDLYVQDECGNVAVIHETITRQDQGYIQVLNELLDCNYMEIYPVYYGFNAPMVCLYRYPQRTLVECKQAPPGTYYGGSLTNFFNLPYGQEWYVIVEDGCYRDSMWFPDKRSAGGVEMNPFAWRCNTFDLHVDGNNSGFVCLYNSVTDQLVSCKPTTDTTVDPRSGEPWRYGGAEWYDLPYGRYYAYVFDPCLDSLIRIDTTVVYPRGFSTAYYNDCRLTESGIGTYFNPDAMLPWTTYIYWPNDSLVTTSAATCTCNPNNYVRYPTYPFPGTIKIIQEDGCGNRDTSYQIQPLIFPARTVTQRGGCPGVLGPSGGADVIVSGNAVAYGGPGTGVPLASIRIIRQDTATVNVPHSYTQWNSATSRQEFYFTNLTTGRYVLESTLGCYGYLIYDTIDVMPYRYPEQLADTLFQCGVNAYTFRDSVSGGVSPFVFELTSTSPMTPALHTGPQTSNVFVIPPHAMLNSMTVQVTDACGNSDTRVFPVAYFSDCTTLPARKNNSPARIIEKGIRLYPNPSKDQFFIEFSRKQKSDFRIDVYNTLGIAVHSQSAIGIDAKVIPIRLNSKPGLYIVHVTDLKTKQKHHFKQLVQ